MNSQFLMAIGRHDGGSVVETIDDRLPEIIAAVRQTGKKGSVSVTMNISPNGENGLTVEFAVAAKAPNVQFGQSFYYTDQNGALTRTAPAAEGSRLLDIGERA